MKLHDFKYKEIWGKTERLTLNCDNKELGGKKGTGFHYMFKWTLNYKELK